jgi:hypothetical protein
MATGITLFQHLHDRWKILWRKKAISNVVHVESMNDLPKRVGARLYIIGKPYPKWVVLRCPCGCGERIHVNLMRSRRPRWGLKMEGTLVSIHPSIWIPEDRCGSHFWIQHNRIMWVKEHRSPYNSTA